MLDTNIFNRVLDEKISLESLVGKELYATHVQHDELNATKNADRRERLLAVFRLVSPQVEPTSTAVWDVSAWEQSKWSDETGLYQEMLERLQTLDTASGKRPDGSNQIRDILIAETAIKIGSVLMSDDGNLRQVFEEFGGTAIASTA